jgi:hypothetical protein
MEFILQQSKKGSKVFDEGNLTLMQSGNESNTYETGFVMNR